MTVSPALPPVPGISMKMSGVRGLPSSSSWMISSFAPSGRFDFAQPASRSTARSTWPFFFQSGSNIADLFGILMYSTSVGTIDLSNCSSTHFAVASVTDMRRTLLRPRLLEVLGNRVLEDFRGAAGDFVRLGVPQIAAEWLGLEHA